MFEDGRQEYSIKTCPSDDTEALENLLNQMSEEGWDLYTLHETESRSGGLQYNCIFVREYDESAVFESDELVEVNDFKSRIEKMMGPSDDPYERCKEIQKQISQKQEEIAKIKKKLDSSVYSSNEKNVFNDEILNKIKELGELKAQLSDIIDPEIMFDRINQDKLTIIISDELIDLVNTDKDGELISETVRVRKYLADELGYILPSIKFTNLETLNANEYRIDIRGIKSITGVVYPGCLRFYANQLSLNRKTKDIIEDIDPINGEKVLWIEESKTKNFWEKGLTPAQVIASSLEYVTVRYINEILDYTDLNRYIEIVGNQNLFLVNNLVPESITLSDLKYILTNLIREKVSVKDIVYVFEKLNDVIQISEEKDEILQNVRIALGRHICSNVADENGNIYAVVISDKNIEQFEETLNEDSGIKNPKLGKLIKNVINTIKKSEINLANIVIVTPLSIRLKVFNLFEQIIPNITVISADELSKEYNMEVIETINF